MRDSNWQADDDTGFRPASERHLSHAKRKARMEADDTDAVEAAIGNAWAGVDEEEAEMFGPSEDDEYDDDDEWN